MHTPRMSIKHHLRQHLRPIYRGMTERQFNLACCEVLDTFAPNSPAALEANRMDAACTLGRLFNEVRRELDREAVA